MASPFILKKEDRMKQRLEEAKQRSAAADRGAVAVSPTSVPGPSVMDLPPERRPQSVRVSDPESWRDWFSRGAGNVASTITGKDPSEAARDVQSMLSISDFAPVVGDVQTGGDVVSDVQKGDYGSAAINTIATALPIIPGAKKLKEGGDLIKGGKKVAQAAEKGLVESGLKRKGKEIKPPEETEFIPPAEPNAPRDQLSAIKSGAEVAAAGQPGVKFTRTYDAAGFHKAIGEAKAKSKFGAAVEQKSPEDYTDTIMFLSDDGKTGYAIKPDGDLVSVFSTEKGRLPSIMDAATRQGATKLDAFDTGQIPGVDKGLTERYGEYGFEEKWRNQWEDKYKPEDWNPEHGTPDQVGMERPVPPPPDPGPLQQVDDMWGTRRPDVMFEGVPPSEFTPGQWYRFGKQYGSPVPMGPENETAWYASLKQIEDKNGKKFLLPGGMMSNEPFTYWDDLFMKAQGINPADLDPALRTAIHNRTVAGKGPPPGGFTDEQIMNQFLMGMTSPNNPLTPNEFSVAAGMVKGPKDLQRFAESSGLNYEDSSRYLGTQGEAAKDPRIQGTPYSEEQRSAASKAIADKVGVGAGERGGLGTAGSADWANISDVAQMMREKPEFFRFRGAEEGGKTHEENWANFVDRIITQVPGLKAKTGSFTGVWQDPVKAGISALDRHMLSIIRDNMFETPQQAKTWGDNLVKQWNKETKAYNKIKANKVKRKEVASVDDFSTTPGGTDFFNEQAFKVINNPKTTKIRTGMEGEVNPDLPAHLHPDVADYVREPTHGINISESYKHGLKDVTAKGARPGSTGLFSDQWYQWDPQRQRFEPHEVMSPALTSVPGMSQEQKAEALGAHAEAGYLNYSKDEAGKLQPVQPVPFKENIEDLTGDRRKLAEMIGNLNPSRLAAFQWLLSLGLGGAAGSQLLRKDQQEEQGRVGSNTPTGTL